MNEFQTIIDISLPLDRGTPIYPNNPPLTITSHQGEFTAHSVISMGSHTGTHIDTPRHVSAERDGLESYSLSQFVGRAIVVDATASQEKITTQDIAGVNIRRGDRVLFKTKNSARGFKEFYSDYVYLDGDCAEYLKDVGVLLVGIDALSIKQRGGADQRPHTTLLEHNIVVLEGIDLNHVEPGEYILACLPMRFTHIDGAPARAVLMR